MSEKKPKMKTNRSAAKRFSKTATGLIQFGAKAHRHCLSNKSRKLNGVTARVVDTAPSFVSHVS